MKNSSNHRYQAYYRKPSAIWKFISFMHCLIYSWQYGLLITYVFQLVFGITGFIVGLIFKDSSFTALIDTIANAPYWLYGTLFCLICLHLGRTELKSKHSMLALISLLAFTHEAMLSNKIMVIFYAVCLLGIIYKLLSLDIFKTTFIFSWPVCKKATVFPFNLSIFILTMLSLGVLWLILLILEFPKLLILSIISVLIKMNALEDFTEYYDIAYEKCSHILR